MQHLNQGAVQSTPATLTCNTILLGDVRSRLRELPENSIDCIITSPPYFGVRNYGHDDQMGAEEHVTAWVDELREVWKTASLEWRASVVRLVVEKVIIHPCKPGGSRWPDKDGWNFRPESVEIVWLH